MVCCFLSLRRSPKPPVKPVGVSDRKSQYTINDHFSTVFSCDRLMCLLLYFCLWCWISLNVTPLQKPELKPREFESKWHVKPLNPWNNWKTIDVSFFLDLFLCFEPNTNRSPVTFCLDFPRPHVASEPNWAKASAESFYSGHEATKVRSAIREHIS